jgi:uncharacterized protein (DUF1697 family)
VIEYAAFLRGVNVGKTKRVKLSDMVPMLEMSFKNIRSYGQSGNIVFDSEREMDVICPMIESVFGKTFGFDIFCVVKTIDEIRTAVERNPFFDVSPDKLFFIFMSESPADTEDDEWSFGEDRAKRIADVIYLECKGEYHRTKLTNNFFEKEFEIICTARNLNTVNAVLKL